MARRPAERPTQRGATACKAVCGRTAVQDTTIPGYAWPSGGLGRKPNKGCEICGDHASECEQMFWLFLERGTRSPDASKIPVDEIVERSGALAARAAATSTPCGRRRALRNRAAAGKSRRGENPPVDQQRRTEHAPLRATRPWTTCARTRSGSERTRSSALPRPLASHPDLPSTSSYGILVLR